MSTPSKKTLRREIIRAEISRSSELATNLYKYGITTNLLLNGGALVALANSDQMRPSIFGYPGVLFVAGIICAAVSALLSAMSFAELAHSFNKVLWRDEELDEDEFDDFLKGKGTLKIRFLTGILAGVSLSAFMVGCSLVYSTPLSPAPAAQMMDAKK